MQAPKPKEGAMTYDTLIVEIAEGVALIRLNRPKA